MNTNNIISNAGNNRNNLQTQLLIERKEPESYFQVSKYETDNKGSSEGVKNSNIISNAGNNEPVKKSL